MMPSYFIALGLVMTAAWAAPVWAQPLSVGRAIFTPIAQATISAELAGVIRDMPLRPGNRFERDDLLVQLDCRLFDAQAVQAGAEREIARMRAENALALEQRNSIGGLEAAVAGREYEKREAAARVARLNAERCQIRAPFDGYVATWEVHPHERAEPGMPLIRIVGSDRFEAEIVAGADWIGNIEPGDHVQIELDQGLTIVNVTVRAIAPEMDPVSQTVTVYAQVNAASDLSAGMTGTATALNETQIAVE